MNQVSKIIGGISLFAVGIFTLTILFGSWYTIDEGEKGIQLRNGAFTSITQPGLHFKVPIVDDVVKFDVRTQRNGWKDIPALSKDLQKASLDITVNYQLDPTKVREIYETLGQAYDKKVIDPAIFDAVKSVFGTFNSASAVNDRVSMGEQMAKTLKDNLAEYNILVQNVRVEDVTFSQEFIHSVEERMKAEIEVEKRHQNLKKAEIEANIVRTQAEGAKDAMISAAEGKATSTKLQGEAEAEAIEARGKALRNNPDLIDLVQAEKWDGKLPSMVPPNGTVPFLDLNKLK